MIAPNELRIGNWVEDEDVSQERFQVKVIAEGVDYTKGMYFINGRWSEDLNPIPLTSEILEKVGFEEMKDNGRGIGVFVNGIYDFEETLLGSGEYSLAIYEEYTQTKISYVHQLQNLMFALTRVELEINII